MRRHALTAALAALSATGCVVATPCTPPTVTISWLFDDAAGNVGLLCNQVGLQFGGVATVDVWSGNVLLASAVPCQQYAVTLPGLAPNSTQLLTVEGIAPDGTTIVDRAQFTATTVACGDMPYAIDPGEGYVGIDYSFSPSGGCGAAGSSMWFSVEDDVAGNVIASATSAASATRYACGVADASGHLIDFSLPLGSYTLSWIEEVAGAGTASPVVVNENCAGPGFAINGPGWTEVPVVLAPLAPGQATCF